MTEIWKDIAGYEGEYQVSNLGNVRSLDRYVRYSNGQVHFYQGIQLKTQIANGYVVVTLKKKRKMLVHRLVAKAFIPNPNKYPEINHLDENKLNNRVDNLEWSTVKDNRNYGTRNMRAALNKDYKAIAAKAKMTRKRKQETGY